MAEIINLETHADGRGKLTVFEQIPFEVKRVYWIYDTDHNRGGHAHKITRQALICLRGSFTIRVVEGALARFRVMHHRNEALILEPEDWHEMIDFSDDCILLVLASEPYDPEDYVY